MDRRVIVIVAFLGVQTGLLVWTAWWPTLGAPVWHHHVSLALALLFTAATWRPMTRNRAYLGIGILVTTLLATVSGFVLLYWKQEFKALELKDWMKWWHIAWSWFALVFFLGHTWLNRGPLLRFWRDTHRRLTPAVTYDGLLLLILLAIPLTWSVEGRGWFTDDNYIPLTLYTWLVLLVPAYGAWLWAKWRMRVATVPAWAGRTPLRRFVNVWLFPATILANVSGFPLLYAKDHLHGNGYKYVAKYWHTWPSIAFAILVFVHSIQSWPPMGEHWRRFGKALSRRS